MASLFVYLQLALLIVSQTTASDISHYKSPNEENVFSPPPCFTDEEGFFGVVGPLGNEVEYFYEAELHPEVEIDSTERYSEEGRYAYIESVERAISDYLLSTTTFDGSCERRRRLQPIDATQGPPSQVVGMSINPRDYHLTGIECQFQGRNDTLCDVIAGMFTFYSLAPVPKVSGLLKDKLRVAMNRGAFNNVNPNIVKLTMIDDLTITAPESPAGPGRGGQIVNTGSSITQIMAAGAVLIFLLLVIGLLRLRRTNQLDRQDESLHRK